VSSRNWPSPKAVRAVHETVAPRPLIALLLVALAPALLAACGDGDDGDEEERAENYALQVERISDHAYEAAQDGLVTLNELADGSVGAQAAITQLARSSAQVTADRERLDDLAPPEAGRAIADDLAFQLDSLARSLDEAAATASAVNRGGGSLEETGRSFARVVLAYQSGSAALSRALRSTVAAAAED
jgi:hypothetical protein